jgi:hypothetical protein
MIGAAMMLTGAWKGEGVFNIEQFDPDPFMDMLNKHGLPWQVKELCPFDVSATVRFAVPVTEDQSLLLDDFHLYSGDGPTVALSIHVLAGNAVDITWPLSAPVNLTLQSSPSLITGTWSNVEALPFVEGNLNHVQDVLDGPKRFYRLVKP